MNKEKIDYLLDKQVEYEIDIKLLLRQTPLFLVET